VPLENEELEPLLRLALVPGVGPTRLAQLVERFGSAERVLAGDLSTLRAVPGIGAELARRIRTANGREALAATRRAIARLDSLGAHVLPRADATYPAPFHKVVEPPYLLFFAGDPGILAGSSIAIVGTRSPTAYGRDAGQRLSRDLALAGFTIVSGMARGVDTAAHLGALDAPGRTVGVLGHGIEQVYPPENARLFERVRVGGALITEFLPGETPKPGNFPRRNRLITALAEAVLVVEMGHRSGAQHTVNYALEQGREVMAVPGPIGSPASEGTNQLIKDGARMVTSAADVIEELRGVGGGWRPPHVEEVRAGEDAAAGRGRPALELLTAAEERVLASLSPVPIHIDDLVRGSGLPPPTALATLLELELRGLVRAAPGKRFSRAMP
jgi:DNA processing protein